MFLFSTKMRELFSTRKTAKKFRELTNVAWELFFRFKMYQIWYPWSARRGVVAFETCASNKFPTDPNKTLISEKNHSQNDLFLGKFVSLSIFSHFSFFIFQFEMRKHTQTFCDPIAMQLKLFFHTSSNNHLLISAGDEIFNHSQSLSLVF